MPYDSVLCGFIISLSQISDQNKDNHLDEKEFMAFIHPQEFDHTKSIHIDESFEDMDKSKDGSISLEEYLGDLVLDY